MVGNAEHINGLCCRTRGSGAVSGHYYSPEFCRESASIWGSSYGSENCAGSPEPVDRESADGDGFDGGGGTGSGLAPGGGYADGDGVG
jgi:hypothetical protein